MQEIRWVGKAAGLALGLLLSKFSLLGGLIGLIVGHQFDKGFAGGAARGAGFGIGRGAAERQRVFFESVFLTMGHLAKADGRVSEEEIRVARGVMHELQLSPEDVRIAIDLFTRGKQPEFPLEAQMQQFAAACQGQPELTRVFLEILLQIPLSTGGIESAERDVLWRVAACLGVGRAEMAQLEAMARARARFGQQGASNPSRPAGLEQAYRALGIESSATDKEVKTAYRRLMNQHHPDKLVAKGLPESMMEAAKERTREIRAAYELIRDHRGMR